MKIFFAPGIAACLILGAAPLCASEYRLVPALVVSEEFNDNLFQEAHDRRTDLVTRVRPSVGFNTLGGGFSCTLSYGIDYRYYARQSRTDEFDHRAGFKGNLSFFDEFLKLDLSDSYSRVSTNVARDVVEESLVANQTEQNVAVISPYLTWRLSPNTTLKTGYRYVDTRYWGVGIEKMEQHLFAELGRELGPGFLVNAGYNFAYVDADTGTLDRHEVYAGFKRDFGRGSFLHARLGNSWQSFSNGVGSSDPFWDLSAGREFGTVTATVGTKAQYTEDPQTISTRTTTHYATVSRLFPRGTASLTASYSEFEKNQQLLPEVQRKVFLGASGRYELHEGVALRMGLSGDRIEGTQPVNGHPYHLYGNLALDYALSRQSTLAASYSWISYRNELDSARDAAEVNRVIVEMRFTL